MGADAKTAFAVICLIGVVAVATGAVLEIQRAARGHSVLTANQHRLRLLSAVIWMISLGSLSYAVLFLWPQRGDLVQEKRFLSVTSGVVLLFFIGLFLLGYDVLQLGRARRRQEQAFQAKLETLSQGELERVTAERLAREPGRWAAAEPRAGKDGTA